jgi:GT2 family glycosyltransferase
MEHVTSWFQHGHDPHGHEHGDLGSLRERSPVPVRGLTLALCTYRRPASVARFLTSLAGQERQPEAIVLVDASPDDATEQVVRAHLASPQGPAPDGAQDTRAPAPFLYVRVEGPLRGLTRQRNLALGWVATDLVVFFDDDIVLLPGCLRIMEDAHRMSGDSVAGVGAFVQEPVRPRRRLWQLRRALGMIGSLTPGRYSRSGFSTPWGFLAPTNELVEGQWLPGCAMMWRTGIARELGFHAALDGYGQGEDLEFSLRALRHGRLLMATAAHVQHLHEPGGRPDHYRLGYMAIHNRYHIHRRGLQDRRPRDVAWFAYAWTLDTLLLLRQLPVPGRSAATAREMAGRVKAAYDLLLPR